MRKLTVFNPICLALAMLVSWVSAIQVLATERPLVIAVNYPLQYFAQRLLLTEADVMLPVPEDADPSFWRPTIADISTIQSADLIMLNGAGFASWVDRVSLPRSKLVNTSAAIKDQFIVTQSITHSHGDGGEHSHEGLASYVWLDPSLAIAQAKVIANTAKKKGLGSASDIDERLSDLIADMENVDEKANIALGNSQNTSLIATHPRYQYFARRYGLSIRSLEWEAGETPTDSQLQEMATLAAGTGAQILIWEAAPPDDAIAKVADLGLQSVVFPPMAHKPDQVDFPEAFADAIEKLAAAVNAAK